MQAKSDGNVRCFAEGGMLRCIVPLTEMINAITVDRGQSDLKFSSHNISHKYRMTTWDDVGGSYEAMVI